MGGPAELVNHSDPLKIISSPDQSGGISRKGDRVARNMGNSGNLCVGQLRLPERKHLLLVDLSPPHQSDSALHRSEDFGKGLAFQWSLVATLLCCAIRDRALSTFPRHLRLHEQARFAPKAAKRFRSPQRGPRFFWHRTMRQKRLWSALLLPQVLLEEMPPVEALPARFPRSERVRGVVGPRPPPRQSAPDCVRAPFRQGDN